MLKLEGIGIFQHEGAVIGSGAERKLSIPAGIAAFVVNQVKVVAFAGIVMDPQVRGNGIIGAVVLNKSAG